MTVQRFDFSQFKAVKTDEGFIVDTPIVGRVGIQTYQNADGTVTREFRPPEEVFNADSLASFKGKPITDNHPSENVTAKNFKQLSIGNMLTDAFQDGENVRVEVVIQDGETIDKIMNGGKRELSLGYRVDLEYTPGEYNGQKYDAIQRNIRINHLAVVGTARAGKIARLNLDKADAYQVTQEEQTMSDTKLSRVRLDNGIEYDAAPEVAHALDTLRDDAATFKANVETANAQIQTLAGERDTLKARVDGFADELAKVKNDALDVARAEIKARAELEKSAEAMKVDHAGKTDREVKELVIKTVRADAELADKSDEYVQAAFDIAMTMKKDDAMADQRKKANDTTKQDGVVTGSSDAYKAYMKNLKGDK